MKKILSFVLVATMLSNSAFAAPKTNTTTNNTQKIAKAFDSFRYKMTVELNPADANFQANAVADFKKRMAKLQAEGVSPAEIMSYMRSSILDAQTRSDFDRMVTSIDIDRVSSEEAGNLAMQFMASKYQQGASYSGGGKASYKIALIIVGIVIVGVVTYLVIKCIKDNKEKTVTKTDTVTKTETKTDTVTHTSVETVTETQTNVVTNTVTTVLTNTETVNNTETVTSYETVNNTETVTNYDTITTTNTVTSYETVTNYNTVTLTDTYTYTYTYTYTTTGTCTDTGTSTDYGYCCNGVSGHAVPASPTGCSNGDALYWVATEAACVKLGPSSGLEDDVHHGGH